MTDGDPRPAPRYGEYATPEKQRELMGLSDGSPLTASHADSSAARESWAAPTSPAFAAISPVAAVAPGPAAVTAPARRGDRFITFALLGYGLFTVFTTVPQLLDFSTFAQMWIGMAGMDGEFTATESGRQWGAIGALLFALGWVATAWLSWRVIRRGRISWWVPLVGAVATLLVVSVCLSVPLLNDPAIVDQIVGQR